MAAKQSKQPRVPPIAPRAPPRAAVPTPRPAAPPMGGRGTAVL